MVGACKPSPSILGVFEPLHDGPREGLPHAEAHNASGVRVVVLQVIRAHLCSPERLILEGKYPTSRHQSVPWNAETIFLPSCRFFDIHLSLVPFDRFFALAHYYRRPNRHLVKVL